MTRVDRRSVERGSAISARHAAREGEPQHSCIALGRKRAVCVASPNGARVRGSAASEGTRIRNADGALLALVHWPLLLDCLN